MKNPTRSYSWLLWILGFILLAGLAELSAGQRADAAETKAAVAAEDWKGTPDAREFDVGGLLGLGILDGNAGFALMGDASKRIIHQGFVSDLNDSVSLEAQLGPLFVSGGTAFVYSVHLRWDFQKDDAWTFYALGGLGGSITGASLGSRFELYPRFGVGAMWKATDVLDIRAEISHELMAVGVSVPLFR